MHKLSAVALCATFLVACGQPDSVVISKDDAESSFTTDDERIAYALGVVLGQNIAQFALSDDELEIVASGMRDAVHDSEFQVNMELYGPRNAVWLIFELVL